MKLKKLAHVISLICIAGPVAAQQTDPLAPPPASTQKVEKIEVTGSSIKRVRDEGALPIQVITSQDLVKLGITSAEQLIATISANGNGVDNMTSQQGGDFLNSTSNRSLPNNGAAAASLRGLGAQYTLVLLNGRRVSTHGLSGKAVDLNSIPLAAVDRVEILKDGASAIYGTDAIGGVINFILRRDYQGLEATVAADVTQHSFGDIYRGSLLAGLGDLAKDRFNIMASLTFDTNGRLRGSQRDFHNGNQPGRGLSPDTTGTPFANIGVAGGTALSRNIVSLPGFPSVTGNYNRLSLLGLQGKCETIPDMSAYRGDITGFPRNNLSCAYDYGKQWSLMQPVDRTNFVSRGTWAIANDHTVFVEVVASRTKSSQEYTPIQITNQNYPAFINDASGNMVRSPYYQDLTGIVPGFNNTLAERIRWRCLPCGPRQQDTTADAYRALVGMDGALVGWDYKLAYSNAQSKANTVFGDGNMYDLAIKSALASGIINPFLLPGQSQTQQAIDAINAAKARGASLFGGKAIVDEFDGSVSKDVMSLPAGPLAAALGFDLRREDFRFNKDDTVRPAINGAQSPASLNSVNRRINAFYGELQVPVIKNLDLQLAVRRDHYSDFGSTTNPKVAARWAPLQQLVFRGSYSKGFHAPDFDALYGGDTVGQFNSDINDPVLCPTGLEPRGCGIRPGITGKSNTSLKAEKSKQSSFGVLIQPMPWLSASVDFWKIDLTDRIGALSGQALISRYNDFKQYVTRDANGDIIDVTAPTFNLAGNRTRGADLNVTANWKTEIGQFVASLDGTYTDSYQSRFSDADPWVELVGKFGDTTNGFDLHLRWKHAANVTWLQGPWSATVSQNYFSSYEQERDGYGAGFTAASAPSRTDSYALYNLSATYTGIKNLAVTAGIKNLFDTKPPYSNHNIDNVAGAGWDARVGDPRLRSFMLRVNYKFF